MRWRNPTGCCSYAIPPLEGHSFVRIMHGLDQLRVEAGLEEILERVRVPDRRELGQLHHELDGLDERAVRELDGARVANLHMRAEHDQGNVARRAFGLVPHDEQR